MRRRPKDIGTAGETAVVGYLRNWFPDVHRLAQSGAQDVGDIGGVEALTLQVKVRKAMELAAWVDQAAVQAERAHTPHFAVVHKRRGKGNAGEWYCTLPLSVFASIYYSALETV
jgi:hypothetical protein